MVNSPSRPASALAIPSSMGFNSTLGFDFYVSIALAFPRGTSAYGRC
jgi:hypothetical protein